LGALCPSKSGLMNKHIVEHNKQTYREIYVKQTYSFLGLSGLNRPVPVQVRTTGNKQTYRETYRER
jgi:hypothetical protein